MYGIRRDLSEDHTVVFVLARSLPIIFGKSWGQSRVPDDWTNIKKGKRGDLENYWPASLISDPREFMEQITLEAICKHMKDKKMIARE